jgi:small GTP-binding protein
MHILKLCVLGDGAVGKTSLIIRHVDKRFVTEYKPTIGFDIALKTMKIQEEGISAELLIWDIAGQAIFEKIREEYLQGTNAAMIIFDLTRQETYDHVKDWLRELNTYAGKVPFVLVGNKADLASKKVISDEVGKKYAKTLGAIDYIETSAKTGQKVEDAFEKIIKNVIETLSKKKEKAEEVEEKPEEAEEVEEKPEEAEEKIEEVEEKPEEE